MRAVTHISFGLLCLGLVSSCTHIGLNAHSMAWASIASILPDIDTKHSTLGKILFPISNYLEKNFGHRTLTHSFWFFLALSAALLPVYFWMSKLIYWSVLIGYMSHLLIDCLNKTGVPFFWPNRTYFVIPGKSRWRIEVGSSSEYILCGIILLLAAGTWYLNRVGIRSWFSSVLATPQMAVNEYRTHSNTHRLKAKVQGFYTINQHPINGESFEIIDALDETTLLVKNSSDQLTTIGNSSHSVIQTKRAVVEKGEQIKIKSDNFVFKNQPISLIMPYTSSNTYISGTVEAHTKPQYIKMDMKPFKNGEFESIKVLPGLGELNSKLELRDASPKQLKQIQNILITGELMSRTVI